MSAPLARRLAVIIDFDPDLAPDPAPDLEPRAARPSQTRPRGAAQVLPWLLGALERLPLVSPRVAAWMIDRHQRALARLLALLPAPPRHVLVVGGGLFPRTPLALRRLLPAARIVVLDAEPAHLERARAWLVKHGISEDGFHFVTGRFHASGDVGDVAGAVDAVIVPLAFEGDREALYHHRGRAALLVHDWLWRRRGRAGTVVSLLCLKRLNLA